MKKLCLILAATFSFVSSATAAQAANPQAAGGSTLFMLAIFFVAMYFMMIRPQNKKMKEHRELIENLAVGDEVVTSGGVLGRISKLTDSFVLLSISEGVDLAFQKNAVSTSVPKGTLKSIK